jgi:hypothetical protein
MAVTPFLDQPSYPAPAGKTMYAAHLLDPEGETVQVGFFAAATDDDAMRVVTGILRQPPEWEEAVSYHLFREVAAKK